MSQQADEDAAHQTYLTIADQQAYADMCFRLREGPGTYAARARVAVEELLGHVRRTESIRQIEHPPPDMEAVWGTYLGLWDNWSLFHRWPVKDDQGLTTKPADQSEEPLSPDEPDEPREPWADKAPLSEASAEEPAVEEPVTDEEPLVTYEYVDEDAQR